MSIFNGILRKPHQPREVEIRALIRDLGLKLPDKPAPPVEEEDDDELDESAESESETEDEVLEPCYSSRLLHHIHKDLMNNSDIT